MVWTLKFAAGRTFVWVRTIKSVVGPTVVPAGFGDFILWDSHVTTSDNGPHLLAVEPREFRRSNKRFAGFKTYLSACRDVI